MDKLGKEAERLSKIKPDHKATKYIDMLIPMPDDPSKLQERNIHHLRGDMKLRYFEAPI